MFDEIILNKLSKLSALYEGLGSSDSINELIKWYESEYEYTTEQAKMKWFLRVLIDLFSVFAFCAAWIALVIACSLFVTVNSTVIVLCLSFLLAIVLWLLSYRGKK